MRRCPGGLHKVVSGFWAISRRQQTRLIARAFFVKDTKSQPPQGLSMSPAFFNASESRL